ncbi:hypothetical protein HZB88_05525 [archaeon]|nr:hypothetical protein [archaeon]
MLKKREGSFTMNITKKINKILLAGLLISGISLLSNKGKAGDYDYYNYLAVDIYGCTDSLKEDGCHNEPLEGANVILNFPDPRLGNDIYNACGEDKQGRAPAKSSWNTFCWGVRSGVLNAGGGRGL